MKPGIQVRGHDAHSPKKLTGSRPRNAELNVFCFFLSPIQSGLSASYPEAILTAFEIEDVNRCPHAHSGKSFRFSAQGVLQVPKPAKWVLWGSVCDKASAQTAQCRAIRVFRGLASISQGCAFCGWVLVGTYGLGAMSPRKKFRRSAHESSKRAGRLLPAYEWRWSITVQRHSPGDSTRHAVFEPIPRCVALTQYNPSRFN